MHLSVDAILRISEQKSSRGNPIALFPGSGMVLPHRCPIIMPARTIREERPIVSSTRIVGMSFRGVRHFAFAKPPKLTAPLPATDRTSAPLHFCNNLEVPPRFFSNRMPMCAYFNWRDQETSRQDKRKVVEMLFLHLKPGSHWRIVAYEDRGMHSVDEPHIPLVVVQDESDGTLMRSAKLRERAILGWEELPQPSELPN